MNPSIQDSINSIEINHSPTNYFFHQNNFIEQTTDITPSFTIGHFSLIEDDFRVLNGHSSFNVDIIFRPHFSLNQNYSGSLYKDFNFIHQPKESETEQNYGLQILMQEEKYYCPLFHPQKEEYNGSLIQPQEEKDNSLEIQNQEEKDNGLEIQKQEGKNNGLEIQNKEGKNNGLENQNQERKNNGLENLKFEVNKKALNKDSLRNVDYISYAAIIFTLFSYGTSNGRLSNEDKALEIFHPKHDSKARDNAKKKIFNRCFKVISLVIWNLCQKLGYKFDKIIKKKAKEKNNLNKKVITNYCRMPMEYYLENSEPKNGNKRKNKILYNKIKSQTKFQQAELLQKILKMTLGEVFIKFLDDDNFVKKEDGNNNDFTTFRDNFKNEYNELLEKEIILDLKKIAYSSMINE